MGAQGLGEVTSNSQRSKKMKKFSFLLMLAVLIAGCGYTTGSLLPGHIKAIHIQHFRNK